MPPVCSNITVKSDKQIILKILPEILTLPIFLNTNRDMTIQGIVSNVGIKTVTYMIVENDKRKIIANIK